MSSLCLVGARVALGPEVAVRANVEISQGYVRRIAYGPLPASRSITVDLDGYLLLPGLINAHDHLEFNLFPRLGRGPYTNSREWARDIYQPDDSPLREHLSVPKAVRLWWGGLKNLLSGVTTVSHHNPYSNVFENGFPVRVIRRYGWAHSMTFEKDIVGAMEAFGRDVPFVIHAGEGTDESAKEEIFALDRMGVLDSRTVLVHGVALNKDAHELRERRGAALVWCPTSNQFTLGTTLDVRSLDRLDRVALGSDSALTARGNLLDEIHTAHREAGLPAETVYRMVTENAASIFLLNGGEGRIQPAGVADLIAIPWRDRAPAEALMELEPSQIQMVLLGGRPQLVSSELAPCLPCGLQDGLEWIYVDGVARKVRAPVSRLLSEASQHLPDGICLAGKRVSA